MARAGIHPKTRRYLSQSYRGITTTVAVNGFETDPIPVNRGVKQGDPLSPLIFNLVIDELLSSFSPTAGILMSDGVRIPCIAYADDLLLLGNSRSEVQRLLNQTTIFFNMVGMRLNVAKCTSLLTVRIARIRKLFVEDRDPFMVDGIPLRQISPDDQFKYLGLSFGHQGVSMPTVCRLREYLDRLCRAPLKPPQKLNILKTYLLPRFFYGFQNPKVTGKLLKKASKLVRSAVRRFLHLPITSTCSYIHASIRDGGLGVQDFATVIPAILLRRLDNLDDSCDGDSALRAVLDLPYTARLRERLSGILKPIGHGRNEGKNMWRDALENSVSGNGLHQGASHPCSSNWISYPPPYWSGRQYIRATQLRGNLLPTVGIVSNPVNARRCRAGCLRSESLSHVLQRCPAVHLSRVRRHDSICKLIHSSASAKGWDVRWEPHYRTLTGLLRKPDLVLLKNDELVVCDVSVNWEGVAPLSVAYGGKQAYYSESDFLGAVRRQHVNYNISVLPFVIGARGTWCSLSTGLTEKLGLSTSFHRAAIAKVLQESCRIHDDFGRAVWARR